MCKLLLLLQLAVLLVQRQPHHCHIRSALLSLYQPNLPCHRSFMAVVTAINSRPWMALPLLVPARLQPARNCKVKC